MTHNNLDRCVFYRDMSDTAHCAFWALALLA